MILTDFYKGQRLTEAQSRYDVTASTGEYDLFEILLINKLKFNVGGLSLTMYPGQIGGQVKSLIMPLPKAAIILPL